MKTLHRYLLRQVLATLAMTVLVFSGVLVVGNILREVLGWLVSGQAPLRVVLEAAALLLPLTLAYALPMGMLAATLLVFGRFSADQELTAARAGGISLLSLSGPVLLLSLFFCGLTAWANLELAPWARAAYKGLAANFTSQLTTQLAAAQLPEGRHIKDFESKGVIFYLGKNRGGNLEDVVVYRLGDAGNPPDTFFARRGRIDLENDGTNRFLVLNLYEVQGVRVEGEQTGVTALDHWQFRYDAAQLNSSRKEKVALRNLSFSDLREELRNIRQLVYERAAAVEDGARKKYIEEQLAKLTTPIQLQMHRQWAFSFACFGFALIGIPLGIRVQRKETNVGFAIALVLVLIYYSLILLGLSLEKQTQLHPHLWLWGPNFLFQGVGGWLLWRANRGF